MAPQVKDHYSLAHLNPESSQYRLVKYKTIETSPWVEELAASQCDRGNMKT